MFPTHSPGSILHKHTQRESGAHGAHESTRGSSQATMLHPNILESSKQKQLGCFCKIALGLLWGLHSQTQWVLLIRVASNPCQIHPHSSPTPLLDGFILVITHWVWLAFPCMHECGPFTYWGPHPWRGKKPSNLTLPPTTANNCHSNSARVGPPKSPLHPCWDVGCLGNLGCCGPAVSRGHPIQSISLWPLVLTMDPSIPKSGATVCISTLRSRTSL